MQLRQRCGDPLQLLLRSRALEQAVARGYPPLSLTHGPTLRAASGTVLYLGLVALLSLGLATGPTAHPVQPWTGLGVLAAYAGAGLVLGAARLIIRDA